MSLGTRPRHSNIKRYVVIAILLGAMWVQGPRAIKSFVDAEQKQLSNTSP